MLDATRIVFDEIKKINGIDQFMLIGGTALSIHCKHRLSEDLDFATTSRQLDRDAVRAILAKLSEKFTVTSANAIGDIHDAINEGLDLYDNQQNYTVDGVKLTFFTYGTDDNQRKILDKDDFVVDGKVKILSVDSLFKTKAIVLTERVKSRDLYDLWWMLNNLGYEIDDLVKTIKTYRPHVAYEHIRYRLLEWTISITDEGFESLINTNVTVESIRDDLRKMVDAFEVKSTEALLKASPPPFVHSGT